MPTFFRLLENTETVERSGRKLEQGQQLLEESHDVGVTILNDLATQRETLTRARNRVSSNTSSLPSNYSIIRLSLNTDFDTCWLLPLIFETAGLNLTNGTLAERGVLALLPDGFRP